MVNNLLQFFNEYQHFAILISICISIVIAIAGIIPSFFVTAANILFFGFWYGTLISFLGEAIGAGVAFLLYRWGFKKTIDKGINKFPRVKKLINAEEKEAFYLVFSLRLIPFIPSGLITFAGAVGKISFLTFFIASSLGKLPALLIEGYSVYQVTQFNWQGKLILLFAAVGMLFWVIRKKQD